MYICLQWKPDLDEILQMAMQDTDPWVSMVGEILRSFPDTGSLHLELELTSGTYAEVLADLKKMGRSSRLPDLSLHNNTPD